MEIDNKGNLRILPSKTSSEKDFDFEIGNWQIHNRKLEKRLVSCDDWFEFEAIGEMQKILAGLGNIDKFESMIKGKHFEGMALRLFNPSTRLWSIYWADSNNGILDIPIIGSFSENLGKFYAKDVWEGTEIIVMFTWEIFSKDSLKWSQAFSVDEGKNWEYNWYMNFERIK